MLTIDEGEDREPEYLMLTVEESEAAKLEGSDDRITIVKSEIKQELKDEPIEAAKPQRGMSDEGNQELDQLIDTYASMHDQGLTETSVARDDRMRYTDVYREYLATYPSILSGLLNVWYALPTLSRDPRGMFSARSEPLPTETFCRKAYYFLWLSIEDTKDERLNPNVSSILWLWHDIKIFFRRVV